MQTNIFEPLSDEIQKQMWASMGISEEFLSGPPEDGRYSAHFASVKHDTDRLRVAAAKLMQQIADRITWKYCAFTSHRRGVRVHVWKPTVDIQNFRSLRTAKVWNKRRLQDAKAQAQF